VIVKYEKFWVVWKKLIDSNRIKFYNEKQYVVMQGCGNLKSYSV
jgi:hypothetical protein